MTYEFHIDHTVPSIRAGFIWVFGSNLRGAHGKGAAKIAHKNFAAPYGKSEGRMGAAYGIPLKDARLRTLPLDQIKPYVDDFKVYAQANPGLKFYVTRVGCGLAGYPDEAMAILFRDAPANCNFAEEWKPWLT
jgi:hypothetical protein